MLAELKLKLAWWNYISTTNLLQSGFNFLSPTKYSCIFQSNSTDAYTITLWYRYFQILDLNPKNLDVFVYEKNENEFWCSF